MCSVAPPASHRSDPSYCRDPFVLDCFLEGRVVLLVLVGVGLGERHHGAIEAVALAEVGANRDAVARACNSVWHRIWVRQHHASDVDGWVNRSHVERYAAIER